LRKKIPDARFTPAKESPEPYWTTRWTTMEVKEIEDWASHEVRTLILTQDVEPAKDIQGSKVCATARDRLVDKNVDVKINWVVILSSNSTVGNRKYGASSPGAQYSHRQLYRRSH
jgi:hypothetical protein